METITILSLSLSQKKNKNARIQRNRNMKFQYLYRTELGPNKNTGIMLSLQRSPFYQDPFYE